MGAATPGRVREAAGAWETWRRPTRSQGPAWLCRWQDGGTLGSSQHLASLSFLLCHMGRSRSSPRGCGGVKPGEAGRGLAWTSALSHCSELRQQRVVVLLVVLASLCKPQELILGASTHGFQLGRILCTAPCEQPLPRAPCSCSQLWARQAGCPSSLATHWAAWSHHILDCSLRPRDPPHRVMAVKSRQKGWPGLHNSRAYPVLHPGLHPEICLLLG